MILEEKSFAEKERRSLSAQVITDRTGRYKQAFFLHYGKKKLRIVDIFALIFFVLKSIEFLVDEDQISL